MAALKKQYVLEGLCCANCAAEIEREIGQLSGVSSANVNFASKLLTVEIAEPGTSETLTEQAQEIAKRHDPDIRLAERAIPKAGSKTMVLLGLDCADCAQKIEAEVSRLDGVASARVDFVTQRLTIDAVDQKSLPALLRKASEIIHEMEPDVEISYSGAETASEETSPKKKERLRQIGMAAGAVLFAVGLVLRLPQPADFILFFISYLLIGGEIVLRAIKNISRGRVFDENFLMSVATIGAFAIGDFPEGVAVMLFYQVGEFFQDLAVNRSRKSISALMDIRPDYANLKVGEEIRKVSPEEVGVGDRILVRPGEKVPLDGRVVEGISSLDTAALTGESLPRDVEPGSEVLSGSVNKGGLLTLEITKEFGESTVSRILDLMQNAGSRKAPTENFITKFAGYYTPVVVFAALALALIPPLVLGDPFPLWINRALTFLVVSCPCALVISIPLSFFGGIGAASRQGILIKGSSYLEALNAVDTVVFDKTGTLTKGSFRVTQINPAKDWTPDELLSCAAHAELYSSHPIAVSIREAYGKEPDAALIADYQEIPGKGVWVTVNGKTVLAGSAKLMDMEHIALQASSESGTLLYLAIGGVFAGSIVIADEIKPDSMHAIESLKSVGVRRTVLLTGDSRTAAETVSRALGLDAVYPELLPQQKVEQLELLNRQAAKGGKLVFVGDGINDAPVLARADIGIAMGGLGSDAAIEAADIVLMTDEPSKIAAAIRIAKRTRSIVRQNIVFALGVKLAILILAAFGIATMWAAVFGDVGVALIAVLNAMRTMRVK